MYVCLCHGVTRDTVIAAIRDGAATSNAVAAVTSAGSACARCKHNIREIIRTRVGWPAALST